MKVRMVSWCLLAFSFLLLAACTPHQNLKIPEVKTFFDEVVNSTDLISKGQLQKFDKVYLTVEYSLTTDDFPSKERQVIFEKTRDFFLSLTIRNLIVEQIGSENEQRMFNEGFTIRFQKPNSETYWVYGQVNGELVLINEEKTKNLGS
ncbi:hypothetical protein EHS13_25055 [Paenibacillus psychroresistens]|uniref:DUF3887 domain-containing protein n=1 Tax=Paenibacillus psychroresistens TaxID=1778678 RepID=A0A6B8RR08_9BACL|nr:hypothetical protein [Paenibacillus psychroresistens]QGQ97923.1 hypothetical protein EHS13_25055 [Paenibacillus psychroresistens]